MKKSTSKGTAGGPPEAHYDPNLIVTRGLQDILEKDRQKKGVATPRTSMPSGRMPKMVLCYLCGKAFGTASISIHRPQCYLKQMIAWERGERREKPVDPETHEKEVQTQMDSVRAREAGSAIPAQRKGMQGKDATNYTDADWDMYNQIQQDTAFSACPNCGRTFLPDRLEVHLRSCRPGHTARPIRSKTTPQEPAADAPSASQLPTQKKNAPSSSSGAAEGGVDDRPLPKPKQSAVEREEESETAKPPPVTAASTSKVAPPAPKPKATPKPEEVEFELIAYESGEVKDNRLVGFTSSVKHNPDSVPDHSGTRTVPALVSGQKKMPGAPPAESESVSEPVSEPELEVEEVANTEEKKTPPPRTGKKIPLNNVSRFKEVESRLKLNRDGSQSQGSTASHDDVAVVGEKSVAKSAASNLCPCQYCSRTFNPDRIAKHESVCMERKNPSPAKAVRTLEGPTKIASTEGPAVKMNNATILKKKAAAKRGVLFCGECGAKLLKEGQTFCNACGMRTQ